MANVIDISILNSVSLIVVFIIIFVGGWGVLQVVDPFKDKGKSFYGLLAFFLAMLLVMSRSAVVVIMTATPWLILLTLIGFFFMFFAKMFGTSDHDVTEGLSKQKGWVILFVAIIVMISLGTALGQGLLAKQPGAIEPSPAQTIGNGTYLNATSGGLPAAGTATNDFGTNLVFTLFHPKILGVLFIFLLGLLTILFLNDKAPDIPGH